MEWSGVTLVHQPPAKKHRLLERNQMFVNPNSSEKSLFPEGLGVAKSMQPCARKFSRDRFQALDLADPRSNSRKHIKKKQKKYIYIYGEVSIWFKFGPFRGYYLVQVGAIIWSKFVFWPIFIVVSSDFCTLSYHFFVCVCVRPIIWQFSKNSVFKNRVQTFCGIFFKFLCFEFLKILFLWLPKHYKSRGFTNVLCLLLLKERKKANKITGISVFCLSKNGRFVTHICFSKIGLPKPQIL